MLAAAQGHATSVRALLTRNDIDVNVQNTQVDGQFYWLFLALGLARIGSEDRRLSLIINVLYSKIVCVKLSRTVALRCC